MLKLTFMVKSFEFTFLAIGLLAAALIVLNLVTGTDPQVFLAFVPLIVWFAVLWLRGRRAV